jgi:phosphoglycolate phosphatase-like HAD superfamily hydrolase
MSRRLLAELGIADHFHGIVGLDAVSAAKLVPAHLIEAIAAVGGDLSRAVTVGDSEIDADTMRAAGTALILVQCATLFCTYPAEATMAAFARVTLARMSEARAVQMNGLGSML